MTVASVKAGFPSWGWNRWADHDDDDLLVWGNGVPDSIKVLGAGIFKTGQMSQRTLGVVVGGGIRASLSPTWVKVQGCQHLNHSGAVFLFVSTQTDYHIKGRRVFTRIIARSKLPVSLEEITPVDGCIADVDSKQTRSRPYR